LQPDWFEIYRASFRIGEEFAMKVTVEFDCTPEEARRFMGLPDVDKVNNVYVDAMANAMKGVTSMDQLETFSRQIAPMGQFGMKLFQNFLESTRQSTSSSRENDSSRPPE
jgi:hypothetical protein